jgi:hypothetical protein
MTDVLLRARVLVTKDGQPFELQVESADGTKHSVWPKLEDVVRLAQHVGRCPECAVADQLQCVLDDGHDDDCKFAEWPYRQPVREDKALRELALDAATRINAINQSRGHVLRSGFEWDHIMPTEELAELILKTLRVAASRESLLPRESGGGK